MFGDKFKPCLKTCVHHAYIYVYTIFEKKISESYLHYVSRYFHTMYEEIITQRQPVDVSFSKCLNPYSFKIDQIVLFVENG